MYSAYRKHRKGFGPFKILGIAVLIGFLIFAVGWIVMFLWNAIVPDVFGLGTITYWQAVGLLILCRILFGGFGKGGHHKRQDRWQEKKRKWRAKWGGMSEAERADWKLKCRDRKSE